jgi:8-oxo-dGTP pyrophosphatase MutT (NUDIX family)
MGYVEELRRLVGTRPLLLPGANVLVFDEAGRVLLQRRRDTGEWGVIGGNIELDETVEEAARREVREETGLEVGALTLVDVVAGPRFQRTYPNGDVVHAVGAVFATSDVRGEPRPDMSEGVELRYFRLDDLPVELMHESSRLVLERYLERRAQAAG